MTKPFSPQNRSKPIWWIPGLGFGIAFILLFANGWITLEMTSQFREYGRAFLQKQASEGLKQLAEEESQLVAFGFQSIFSGRPTEDLLSEEIASLFMFDLGVFLDVDGHFSEGFIYGDEGKIALEPGSPWLEHISVQEWMHSPMPMEQAFVSYEENLYTLYYFTNPRDEFGEYLVLGRKMPSTYAKLPGASETMYRMVPHTDHEPDLKIREQWRITDLLPAGEMRELGRRGGFPRGRGGLERFRRGGPPMRGGPGGQRFEGVPPLTANILDQSITLAREPVLAESGATRALLYTVMNDRTSSESVRLELLVSRDLPETLESTIRTILRISLGISLLIILFTLVVVSEMRRRKKAEDNLTDRNQQLNTANQRKDRLLTIISHDLRAPLSGVTNLSGLMMKQPESFTPDEIRKFAGEIQSTSKHLTELLDNLLNWARLQTGQLPYFPGNIDMERVAHQVRTLFDSTAKEKQVQLEIRVPRQCQLVNDVEMLRTILRNLFSNAIRHTPAGGKVALICQKAESTMRIEVKDTGEGMTPEQIGQLFQLPDQPRNPTDVGKKGAGFGLVLARKLAHRMGGELSVVSVPDQGTTFMMEVPLQWLPDEVEEPPDPAFVPSQKEGSI